MVCLLLVLLVLPCKVSAAGDYSAINANVPLRAAILASYGIADKPFDSSLVDSLQVLNASNRTYSMDLSLSAMREKQAQGILSSSHSISSLSGIGVLGEMGIRQLNLDGQKVAFASAGGAWTHLAGIGSLKALTASNCGITTASGLGNMALESLNLSGNSLRSASAIAACTGITQLDISENPITDLSPLAGMQQLKTLSAGGGAISSYSFLSGLNQLETLVIVNGGFEDGHWGSLAGLAKLQQLILENNALSTVQPLQQMIAGGSFPSLQSISLTNNYIGELARSRPSQLYGVLLNPGCYQQYEVVITHGGQAVSELAINADTTVRVGRRLIGGGSIEYIPPAAYNVDGTQLVATGNGGSITLSPRKGGTAQLKVYAIAGVEAASAQIPVAVGGGTLSARLELTAEGRSVYKDYTGLVEGAQVELAIPSREECAAMFKAVGIDMDDFDMPATPPGKISAGETASVYFPRISDGTVSIIHQAENGSELAREKLGPLRAGSYTYQPRQDIPGYLPASDDAHVKIGYSNRDAEVVFKYRYSDMAAGAAKDHAASMPPVQGGALKQMAAFGTEAFKPAQRSIMPEVLRQKAAATRAVYKSDSMVHILFSRILDILNNQ